jgi:hypothetical protein
MPHVRMVDNDSACVGIKDGITHLIELVKGNQQSRVNGMTMSEPLAIQPERESC